MSKNDSSKKYGGENIKYTKTPKVIRAIGAAIVVGTGSALKFMKSENGKKMVANGAKSLGKIIQKL